MATITKRNNTYLIRVYNGYDVTAVSYTHLNQKIKRNTLTKEELEKIAVVLGGIWKAEFEFPDGTKI